MLRMIVLFAAFWAVVVFAGCTQQQSNSTPNPTGGQNSKWGQMNSAEMANAPRAKSPEINPTTFFAAGVLLENQGNMTGAIDKYTKAIEMDPTHQASYNHLGEIHLKLQQFDQARAVYLKALKHMPNDPIQLNNLGFVYLTQHRYAEAEKELTHALKINPNFPRAHMNLGIALAKQGKYPESLNQFRAACPEAQANYNLAVILHAEDKVNLAKKYYQTALKFDPDFKQAKEGLEGLESRPPTASAPTTTSRPS